MYVHTREHYILAKLYLLICLPIYMYVHTRERDIRPGFDDDKIKFYYYYYYEIKFALRLMENVDNNTGIVALEIHVTKTQFTTLSLI